MDSYAGLGWRDWSIIGEGGLRWVCGGAFRAIRPFLTASQIICRPYNTTKTSFYSASARSFNIPTFLIEISHSPLYLMYLVEHLS
jgi:hypothetical protein